MSQCDISMCCINGLLARMYWNRVTKKGRCSEVDSYMGDNYEVDNYRVDNCRVDNYIVDKMVI